MQGSRHDGPAGDASRWVEAYDGCELHQHCTSWESELVFCFCFCCFFLVFNRVIYGSIWRQINWLTDWMNASVYGSIDRSIDWLIDWLIDRWIDWLIDRSIIDWVIDWSIGYWYDAVQCFIYIQTCLLAADFEGSPFWAFHGSDSHGLSGFLRKESQKRQERLLVSAFLIFESRSYCFRLIFLIWVQPMFMLLCFFFLSKKEPSTCRGARRLHGSGNFQRVPPEFPVSPWMAADGRLEKGLVVEEGQGPGIVSEIWLAASRSIHS